MSLFRPCAYTLADAMAHSQEWHTRADLEAIVKHPITSVDPYPDPKHMLDPRIGWQTHIVMTSGGPRGFTNSPLPVEPA